MISRQPINLDNAQLVASALILSFSGVDAQLLPRQDILGGVLLYYYLRLTGEPPTGKVFAEFVERMSTLAVTLAVPVSEGPTAARIQ